jgi:phosphoglycolate phosphatase
VRARFPLVLFDLDGTLVDSFHDIRDAARHACAHLGVEASPALLALATRGAPLEDFFHLAFGAAHDQPDQRERFAQFVLAYRGYYLPRCLDRTVPYPGVKDTLRALKGLSPKPAIGVATTKRTDTAKKVLSGTGLAELVDFVSGSDGLPHKPDPAVLAQVARDAGQDVCRSVMVGDTDRDVLAARAARCASVGVTYGGFSAAEMSALRPDHIIDAMPELLAIVTE